MQTANSFVTGKIGQALGLARQDVGQMQFNYIWTSKYKYIRSPGDVETCAVKEGNPFSATFIENLNNENIR